MSVTRDEQIENLTRERDQYRLIALAAMGTMTDGQLAEMRTVLDSDPDATMPDIPAVDSMQP